MSPNMSFKKPTWLGKYGLKPSKTSSSINKSHTPSLDLIRVYARDFTASSKFKTVVLDDAMTVSGLVGAALKRFKLSSSTSDGRNNHKLYYLSILRGNGSWFILL